jgi:hypothetical protein
LIIVSKVEKIQCEKKVFLIKNNLICIKFKLESELQ